MIYKHQFSNIHAKMLLISQRTSQQINQENSQVRPFFSPTQFSILYHFYSHFFGFTIPSNNTFKIKPENIGITLLLLFVASCVALSKVVFRKDTSWWRYVKKGYFAILLSSLNGTKIPIQGRGVLQSEHSRSQQSSAIIKDKRHP